MKKVSKRNTKIVNKSSVNMSKIVLFLVSIVIFVLIAHAVYKKVMYPIFYKYTERLIELKVKNLQTTQYFEHTDDNINGCTFDCRVDKVYPWYLSIIPFDVSENLYHGPCNESNAYILWEKSPKHKENLEKIPSSDFNILKMQPDNAKDGRNWCYGVLEIVKY